MSRMWEIREEHEGHSEPKYGYREESKSSYKGDMTDRKDDSFGDGYDCGYEDGYRAAMKEIRRSYERR